MTALGLGAAAAAFLGLGAAAAFLGLASAAAAGTAAVAAGAATALGAAGLAALGLGAAAFLALGAAALAALGLAVPVALAAVLGLAATAAFLGLTAPAAAVLGLAATWTTISVWICSTFACSKYLLLGGSGLGVGAELDGARGTLGLDKVASLDALLEDGLEDRVGVLGELEVGVDVLFDRLIDRYFLPFSARR